MKRDGEPMKEATVISSSVQNISISDSFDIFSFDYYCTFSCVIFQMVVFSIKTH